MKKLTILFSVFSGLSLLVFGFQNCSPTKFSNVQKSSSLVSTGSSFCLTNPQDSACQQETQLKCKFNGAEVADGQQVTAYQNSSGVCNSEVRVCNNGQLSGSFNYATCEAAAPKACLFNGETIQSGKFVTAFQNSSTAAGTSCVSEKRVCTDGVLSGSYSYANCQEEAYSSCLFNGQTIKHGDVATGYLNSTVGFGKTCQSEVRKCFNGIMSGTYNYASCTVAQPASCTFNGQTMAHGESRVAFISSSVSFGEKCQSETRTCNDGTLSGSFSFAGCNVGQPAACDFNGQTIAHGTAVTSFLNPSVVYGGACVSEQRICNNGVLAGSYKYGNCAVDAPANCMFNGQTIAHGESVKSYLTSSVSFGQSCQNETRVCSNGKLSGSFTFTSCAADQPAACIFDGKTIAHGADVTVFQNSSVPAGQSCVSEKRICSNGSLSGSFGYGSCVVDKPLSCLFNGQTIPHGSSVPAFATSSIGFGNLCKSENRTCNNGVLSGTAPFASCTTEQPKSCLFDGKTLPHGTTTIAFSTSSVGYNQSCSQETRTCNNGVLSGSNAFGACIVVAARSCSFNGQNIPHGASVTAYSSGSVGYGLKCSQESRTCTDGVLSGSYTFGTCSPEQPKACVATPININCTTTLTCDYQTNPVSVESKQVVATIPAVAHGSYSSIGQILGYSSANYRYKCENGNFTYAPLGAATCSSTQALPQTDLRCPQRNLLNDSCNNSPQTYHEIRSSTYKNFSDVTSGTIPVAYLCDSETGYSTLANANKAYYYIYDNCGEAVVCDDQIDVKASLTNSKNFNLSPSCLSKLQEGKAYTINLYNPQAAQGSSQSFIRMYSYKSGVDFSPAMPRSTLTKQNGKVVMWGPPLAVSSKTIDPQYLNASPIQALDATGGCDSNSGIYSNQFRDGTINYKMYFNQLGIF